MLRGSWAFLGEVPTILIAAIALMQVDAWRNAARCQTAIRTAIVTCSRHGNKFPLLSCGYRSDGGTAPGEAHPQEGIAIDHPKPMTTMRNLQNAAAAAAEPSRKRDVSRRRKHNAHHRRLDTSVVHVILTLAFLADGNQIAPVESSLTP
ncbi:hypothetical protein BKA56DRAFT_357747 [Ilyonectria sp. MPI-CAGE-AT-0026]|nr:hypothetical protein BKA56DRAFT_357747 [Ilyonectria sp. MPI-CAGE-AT-0026]